MLGTQTAKYIVHASVDMDDGQSSVIITLTGNRPIIFKIQPKTIFPS